jgi:MFS family permease
MANSQARNQPPPEDGGAHTRWNFPMIVGEASAFMTGLAWVDPATVLPLFVTKLTGSTVIVGLMTMMQRLGYLLPQLPMAAILGHRPRRAPVLRWGVLLGRMPFIAFAIYLWASDIRAPSTVIPFMIFAYFSTHLGNGVVAVSWQDIIAKSIPSALRGRFFGAMTFVTAVSVMVVGFVVRRMLGPAGPGYPRDYQVLFTLVAVFFTLSTVGCWLVREPIRPVLAQRQSFVALLVGAIPTLRDHRALRYLAVSALIGFSLAFSTPFYMVHAKQELGVPDETAGIYIWAMTLGIAVSSIAWGILNDRRGPRDVVRGACMFASLAPVLALTLAALRSDAGSAQADPTGGLVYLYGIVFLSAGMAHGGIWMGVTNYLFEMATHEERPRYIGLMSLVGIPGAFSAFVVGWALTWTSFAVVFSCFAVAGAAAMLTSWLLPRDPMPAARARVSA